MQSGKLYNKEHIGERLSSHDACDNPVGSVHGHMPADKAALWNTLEVCPSRGTYVSIAHNLWHASAGRHAKASSGRASHSSSTCAEWLSAASQTCAMRDQALQSSSTLLRGSCRCWNATKSGRRTAACAVCLRYHCHGPGNMLQSARLAAVRSFAVRADMACHHAVPESPPPAWECSQ